MRNGWLREINLMQEGPCTDLMPKVYNCLLKCRYYFLFNQNFDMKSWKHNVRLTINRWETWVSKQAAKALFFRLWDGFSWCAGFCGWRKSLQWNKDPTCFIYSKASFLSHYYLHFFCDKCCVLMISVVCCRSEHWKENGEKRQTSFTLGERLGLDELFTLNVCIHATTLTWFITHV